MKVTLTWHAKSETYTTRLSIRQVVGAVVLAAMFFIVSSRSTDSVHEDIARIQHAKHVIKEDTQTINRLNKYVDDQFSAYSKEIASLNLQLKTLDKRTQVLASQMDIDLPNVYTSEDISKNQIPALSDNTLVTAIATANDSLERQLNQLDLLENIIDSDHMNNQIEIQGRPVEWGWLSSHYGLRDHPITGQVAMHYGVDFAGKANGNVIATGAGIVTWAGDRYNYGLLVEIDHGNGLVTRYGHNSKVNVKIGDVVTKGQVIAAMGSTGRSTGVHVHYEVLKHGKQVDPLAYLN